MQVIWSDISILPCELVGETSCQKSVLYLKVEVASGGGGGLDLSLETPLSPKTGTSHGGFWTVDRRS